MTRLQSELQRLYLPTDAAGQAPPGAAAELAGADGRVRAMVLELARPAGWSQVSTVWQSVQLDLDLPAPAIAIGGVDSYQLWFSLAEAVSPEQAAGFLAGLRDRYLRQVAPEALRLRPSPATAAPDASWPRVTLPPVQVAPERWAAFLAPDLAALFADERWLDHPPGEDAQAELLSRIEPATPEAFARALERLAPAPGGQAMAPVAAPQRRATSTSAATDEADPRRFLLSVMQDPSVELALRIEAARALLQHTGNERPH